MMNKSDKSLYELNKGWKDAQQRERADAMAEGRLQGIVWASLVWFWICGGIWLWH